MLWKKVNSGFQFLYAILPPIFLPCLHMILLYYGWAKYSRKIEKKCSCSCWDTVFKGIASYKHVYFNATLNTLKIWTITVVFVISFYESIKRVLILQKAKILRYKMAILFFSSIFPHYYSWWSLFNYWNDNFYSQWNHQLIFSITEILSTAIVLRLADKTINVTKIEIFTVSLIAIFHISVACFDQFVYNVIKGHGYSHQVLRDIGFMLPDVLHLFLPLAELRKSNKAEKNNKLIC